MCSRMVKGICHYGCFYRYYWANIVLDINSYIKSCTRCQRVNKRLKPSHATLNPISVHSLWHRIGVDLVGPLPRTKSGNAYIVTCSDYFTKWPEAAAIPDKSAANVASFLYQLITRHGSPAIIQSDQGREFVNQVAIIIMFPQQIHACLLIIDQSTFI